MEIPQKVQDKVKCSECDEFLSCGPVYLLHETGGTICGRCSQQSQENDPYKNSDRTRIIPYEAVASLLAFPCAFSAQGCPEKVPFSMGQPPHESDCKFRTFICPVASRGSCEWIGSWPKLMKHCQENHPGNILENPCTPPRPDLTTSNLQTFVVSVFRFVFLLHVKVCVSSGKLFHSVRMFGDSKLLNKFTFTLDIEGNNIKLTKLGSVLRAGILTLQEPTAICTTINSLLDILDGKYNDLKFTIAIQTPYRSCLNCSNNIEYVSESKFCDECLGKLIKCKYNEKGCSFVDVNKNKCEKHEKYYCKYQTNCCLCSVNFVAGSFIEHLNSSSYCRKRVTSNIDSVVRVKSDPNVIYIDILFTCKNIGSIICSYNLSNSKLKIHLYTSLTSYELKNFKCSIELTDPKTIYTKIVSPEIHYNNHTYYYDYSIIEDVQNFPSAENIGIDMKININKM